MKDMVVVGSIIIAFALFVTAHVAITYGLAFRPPRWRAPVAFLVAPLAALLLHLRKHVLARLALAPLAFELLP